jgi:DNA primase
MRSIWKGALSFGLFAPVSAPLQWKEVKRSLNPTDFYLFTIPKRFSQKGDLFRSILKKESPLKNF